MSERRYWLFKEEPTSYSYDDLVRDSQTTWTGVSNALALKHLRQVQAGDRIWFYATGKVKAIVGEMEAVQPASDEGSVVVKPIRKLPQPVSLATIKADAAFADWELVRLPRLSVMPVTAKQWQRIVELAAHGTSTT